MPQRNLPESIRLFMICEGLRWSVLPVAGGLYDQHPKLLDQWTILLHERAEHERREHEKEKAKNARAQRRPPSR